MEKRIKDAQNLLKEFKGKDYTFGIDCLDILGNYVSEFGDNILLVISSSRWAKPLRKKILNILDKSSIKILEEVDTAAPNTPIEDVIKLADIIKSTHPDSITCVGGGSAIDCAKAANVLASLSPEKNDLEPFFGVGKVSEISKEKKSKLYPLIVVQVASGSGAHLSGNENVTFNRTNQKKLISDNVTVPQRAVFDYYTTLTAPVDLTMDGALDGLAHSLEIYYGTDSSSKEYDKIEKVCLTSIAMIVDTLPLLLGDLKNVRYREIIGLATDLGGYALMLGGTNGAHLNSFTLVDIVTHGRACAILNPYYTVFFSTAIKGKLEKLADIYKNYIDRKYAGEEILKLNARHLGEVIAEAMVAFSKEIGFPTKLSEIEGFTNTHIDKMIEAAKNPQLDMKLKNMPVPLSAELIDEYMRPVLEAAKTGDFSLIKNIPIRYIYPYSISTYI